MLDLDLGHCIDAAGGSLDGDALLAALRDLPAGSLPLQQACVQGGIVDQTQLGLSLLGSRADDTHVHARVGVFFNEVVGGCNCHDDPAATPSYAVLAIAIAREDGRTRVTPGSETDTAVV